MKRLLLCVGLVLGQQLEPNYQFSYRVSDINSGQEFGQEEERHGENTDGQYQVQLPDGRTQIVTYSVADPASGYVAAVKYTGEAVFQPLGQQREGRRGGQLRADRVLGRLVGRPTKVVPVVVRPQGGVRPAAGVIRPRIGVIRPSGGVTRPVGGVIRPSGGVTRPVGGVTRPTGGVTRPRVGLPRPVGVTRARGEVTRSQGGIPRPLSLVTRPNSLVTRPNSLVTRPSSAVTRPRQGVTRPGVTRPRPGVTRAGPRVTSTRPGGSRQPKSFEPEAKKVVVVKKPISEMKTVVVITTPAPPPPTYVPSKQAPLFSLSYKDKYHTSESQVLYSLFREDVKGKMKLPERRRGEEGEEEEEGRKY